MGIISRLFLLLYTLVTGSVVVILACACLDVMPSNFWEPSLKFLLAQPEMLVGLAVMFLLSLFLLSRVFVSTDEVEQDQLTLADDEIILQKGMSGEVKVAIDAIQRISERAALTVNGVRESQAAIFKDKTGSIAIRLTIVLGHGYAAPVVSENASNAINSAIEAALLIPEVPVEVKVTDITNAIGERKQRVV